MSNATAEVRGHVIPWRTEFCCFNVLSPGPGLILTFWCLPFTHSVPFPPLARHCLNILLEASCNLPQPCQVYRIKHVISGEYLIDPENPGPRISLLCAAKAIMLKAGCICTAHHRVTYLHSHNVQTFYDYRAYNDTLSIAVGWFRITLLWCRGCPSMHTAIPGLKACPPGCESVPLCDPCLALATLPDTSCDTYA